MDEKGIVKVENATMAKYSLPWHQQKHTSFLEGSHVFYCLYHNTSPFWLECHLFQTAFVQEVALLDWGLCDISSFLYAYVRKSDISYQPANNPPRKVSFFFLFFSFSQLSHHLLFWDTYPCYISVNRNCFLYFLTFAQNGYTVRCLPNL
mgnify:CR=1 FL=1